MACLVLIDWENVSKDIMEGRYVPERFSRSIAIERLFKWIEDEADEIFDTFLFTPIYMIYTDYQLFHDNNLVPITCPKVPLGSLEQRDTVDAMLIQKGLKWITHPSLTHLCLVSGDSDFIPLLKQAKERGLLIMLSALDPALLKNPEYPSLSKELAEMADISPKTGKKMIHYFSPMI